MRRYWQMRRTWAAGAVAVGMVAWIGWINLTPAPLPLDHNSIRAIVGDEPDVLVRVSMDRWLFASIDAERPETSTSFYGLARAVAMMGQESPDRVVEMMTETAELGRATGHTTRRVRVGRLDVTLIGSGYADIFVVEAEMPRE